MKKTYKAILIIFIFSILMMIPIITLKSQMKGHDTDFHVANISAIVNKLSIQDLFVQEPLGKIANDFGYGTRFFYPPLPHLVGAYITKLLTVFQIDNVIIGMRITRMAYNLFIRSYIFLPWKETI